MANKIQFNSTSNRLEYVKFDKTTGKPVSYQDVCIGLEVNKILQPLNER